MPPPQGPAGWGAAGEERGGLPWNGSAEEDHPRTAGPRVPGEGARRRGLDGLRCPTGWMEPCSAASLVTQDRCPPDRAGALERHATRNEEIRGRQELCEHSSFRVTAGP